MYSLGEEESAEAEALADSKYRTWEWNYAYGPEYHFNNRFEIDRKQYSCNIFVKDGIIWECAIERDEKLNTVAKNLIGIKHMPADLLRVFRENSVAMTDDDVYGLF